MSTEDQSATRHASTHRFRCAECGGEEAFDPPSGRLKCPYCGAARAVPSGGGETAAKDVFSGLALVAADGGGFGCDDVRTASCQECGAHVVFPAAATATQCAFCGSSKVLDEADHRRVLRPTALLPFAVDGQRARRVFGDWLRRLWLRPSDLRAQSQLHELVGVYVPFWTFDAHLESSWTADSGYFYWVEEEVESDEPSVQGGATLPARRKEKRRVRHTRWEHAWGRRSDDYRDLLVCASHGLPRELADRLRSFNMATLVPYSPGYIAGWRAEEYGVDLQRGYDDARARMEAEQRRRCAGDVPGDTQRALAVHNTLTQPRYRHVLLPIWIAAYRYHKRVYRFLVNGQSGEIVGKAPWSWRKITLLVASILVAALLLYLYFKR